MASRLSMGHMAYCLPCHDCIVGDLLALARRETDAKMDVLMGSEERDQLTFFDSRRGRGRTPRIGSPRVLTGRLGRRMAVVVAVVAVAGLMGAGNASAKGVASLFLPFSESARTGGTHRTSRARSHLMSTGWAASTSMATITSGSAHSSARVRRPFRGRLGLSCLSRLFQATPSCPCRLGSRSAATRPLRACQGGAPQVTSGCSSTTATTWDPLVGGAMTSLTGCPGARRRTSGHSGSTRRRRKTWSSMRRVPRTRTAGTRAP